MTYEDLEKRIGYTFHDRELLIQALTHSTYAYEANTRPGAHNGASGGVQTLPRSSPDYICPNETLEFLGDSVLGFVISDRFYRRMSNIGEGELTRRRASVVCEKSLAGSAASLEIDGLLRIGKAMGGQREKIRDSVLADAMEAIFAAVYLDGGMEEARRVILSCLGGAVNAATSKSLPLDSKTMLQEQVQSTDKTARIEYSVISETGPVHKRQFTSGVIINGRETGRGSGMSRKESEQNAAAAALEKLRCI